MKKFILLLNLILIFTIFIIPFKASAYTFTNFDIQSKAAMIVSIDTGTILYAKNPDQKLYPASLTKIMTAVVALEKAKNLDAVVTVSKPILDALLGTDLAVGGLKAGEQLTLRQLLNIMIVSSGSDSASVIANFIGGDTGGFIKMMNDKAATLKMTNTNFSNPIGFHEDSNYTTVTDLYKLTLHAITLPTFQQMCNQSKYTLGATNKNPARTISTTNLMLSSNQPYYYQYITGIKTGYTSEAGRCLISTASKDGYNYICIVLGAPPKDAKGNSIRREFTETKNLYKWAFDTFEYKQVINKNDPIAEIPLNLAWETDHIALYPKTDYFAIIPKVADTSSILFEPILSKSSVNAPVKSGTVFGYAKIKYAGQEIGRVDIVANETVNRNEILYYVDVAKKIISNFFFQAGSAVAVFIIILLIIINIIHNKRRRKMKHVRSRRRI